MTLATIDATISGHRAEGDRDKIVKSIRLLKTSEEFYRLVNTTTAIGLQHLGLEPVANVGPLLEFVENAMALAVEIGYKIREQETASQELEMLFGVSK